MTEDQRSFFPCPAGLKEEGDTDFWVCCEPVNHDPPHIARGVGSKIYRKWYDDMAGALTNVSGYGI
jgi:hypothetical protein